MPTFTLRSKRSTPCAARLPSTNRLTFYPLDSAKTLFYSGDVEIHLGRPGDGAIDEASWLQSDPGRAYAPAAPSDSDTLAVEAHPIASSDFNSDGHADLAVGRVTTGRVDVLLGAGDGTFQEPISYDVVHRTTSIAVADLDWNGAPDLVVAGSGGRSVLFGTPLGSFVHQPLGLVPGLRFTDVAIGDINLDWDPDVVFSYSPIPPFGFYLYGEVYVGDGNLGSGTLNYSQILLSVDEFADRADPQEMALADLNSDSRPELIMAEPGRSRVRVFAGVCPFGFDESCAAAYAVGGARALALADVDADGRRDVVVGGSGGVWVLHNVSQGRVSVSADGSSPLVGALDCGAHVVGTSQYCWMQVENTGDARMQLSGATVSGPNAADFTPLYWCGGFPDYLASEQLNPGSRCWVILQFSPSAAGPRAAQLELASDAENAMQIVPLTGVGLVAK